VKDFEIVNGDTLKDPAFIERGRLKTFNICLANPPYSISSWDRSAFETDKYGRNFLGVPPQSRADYAFIQHILKSLDDQNGRCAILLPHGVLFRNEEKTMRENLVKSNLIEAVIGLAAGLFYNSPMEACIIICRKKKAPERKNKILFINAVDLVERKSAESNLTDEHIKTIANAYFAYNDVEGLSLVADNADIAAHGYLLNIALYVRKTALADQNEGVSLGECYALWDQQTRETQALFETLNSLLKEAAHE
jgi:type I restriction enzyme M protein